MMIEKKSISLKMTIDEWDEIDHNYRCWIMKFREPISRHKWMKNILLNAIDEDE